MKIRLIRTAFLLLSVHAANRANLPSGPPVGVLLETGDAAIVVPPGQESAAAKAEPGSLLYYGSQIRSGGRPFSFAFYPQRTLYTFSPKYTSLPLPNRDPMKAAAYEVRLDLNHGVILQDGDLARSVLPGPLLLPDPRGAGRGGTAANTASLIAQIDAALQTAPNRRVEALLRLSRATALESSGPRAVGRQLSYDPQAAAATHQERARQLSAARQEYERAAALFDQLRAAGRPPGPSWIRNLKLPVLQREIGVENNKFELARRSTGRTLAVIVGISNYEYEKAPIPASEVPAVPYAERDLQSLTDYLRSPRGGLAADQVFPLPGSRATLDTIRNTLRNVLENLAGPQDTILVFLSGQGWTETIGGAARGFFMAYNSNPQEKEGTAYPLTELGEMIRRNAPRVKQIYLVADLCRKAALRDTPNIINSLIKTQLTDVPGELEVLLSSSADIQPVQVSEVSANLEGGGRSFFSYFLVKGLQGEADFNKDLKVSPDELFRYVSEQVASATGGKQQPAHFGQLAPGATLANLSARAGGPGFPYSDSMLLAFAGRLRPGLLAFSRAADPAPQQPAPGTGGAALEDEGQQILLQYLDGEETPPPPESFERAADLFRRAYAAAPSLSVQARLLFFEGRSKVFRRDAGAVEDLQAALELDPQGAYAYNGLGIALLQQAAFGDAAGAFRDAIDRAPHWVYPHHNLALTYAAAGAYDAAEREYREAVRMEPAYSYVHYSLAALLHKLGRRKEAEREYRNSIQLNPSHPEPYAGLGALLASTGRHAEAERIYKTAIGLNPKVPAAAHNLGLLYSRQKKLQLAIATWEDNVRLNPDFVPSRMTLAQAYRDSNRLADAIAQYRAVLAGSPRYAAAEMALHETLGDQHREQGQMEEARQEYTKARAMAADEKTRKRLKRKLR